MFSRKPDIRNFASCILHAKDHTHLFPVLNIHHNVSFHVINLTKTQRFRTFPVIQQRDVIHTRVTSFYYVTSSTASFTLEQV